MKGKASDICPMCKHYSGMTPYGMYSCGYADDGSELNIDINVVFNCANFEEVNMNKIEGKVADFCPKCKNCKGMNKESNGVHARLTEIECEKKYRDEISKLQNIVTEKEVEIKGLKKDIIDLSYDRRTVKSIMDKNIKFKQTISDQEITIKALLITIKEMCKEENEKCLNLYYSRDVY